TPSSPISTCWFLPAARNGARRSTADSIKPLASNCLGLLILPRPPASTSSRESRFSGRGWTRGLQKKTDPLVIHNPLVPQLLQELADVGANLGGIGVAELGLQFCDDLAEGAVTVAALQNLAPCALQLDCAFGE